jgi:hypothetical protein
MWWLFGSSRKCYVATQFSGEWTTDGGSLLEEKTIVAKVFFSLLDKFFRI